MRAGSMPDASKIETERPTSGTPRLIERRGYWETASAVSNRRQIVFVILAAILLVSSAPLPHVQCERGPYRVHEREAVRFVAPAEFRDFLVRACGRYFVPINIAAAQINEESVWDPCARSKRNRNGSYDLGLAQLNSYYIAEFAFRYNGGKSFDPFDPETSIEIGVRHLATCRRVTGDWTLALVAYNAGIERTLRGNAPESSYAYATRIMEAAR